MAITRLTAPSDPASADTDWTELLALKDALFLAANGPILKVLGGNIVKGAVFQIGGTVYLTDADTSITGTESPYVKITPAGASASAAYVANLTGVTWNDVYNGWYDGSGNLYVFDENAALIATEISELHSVTVNQDESGNVSVPGALSAPGGITENGINIYRKRYEIGPWDMDADASVIVDLDIDILKVISQEVYIISDSSTALLQIHFASSGDPPNGYALLNILGGVHRITLGRRDGGSFDSVAYNDGSMNRGYITLEYID